VLDVALCWGLAGRARGRERARRQSVPARTSRGSRFVPPHSLAEPACRPLIRRRRLRSRMARAGLQLSRTSTRTRPLLTDLGRRLDADAAKGVSRQRPAPLLRAAAAAFASRPPRRLVPSYLRHTRGQRDLREDVPASTPHPPARSYHTPRESRDLRCGELTPRCPAALSNLRAIPCRAERVRVQRARPTPREFREAFAR